MSNTEDLTEQFQEWYGDKLKVNSAIHHIDTGMIDITITPIAPVEHIDISIKVSRPEVWTDNTPPKGTQDYV